MNSRTYIIFSVLNASFIPIIYLFFPETSHLSLEALDSIFDHPGITRGVLSKEHRQNMLELSRVQQHADHRITCSERMVGADKMTVEELEDNNFNAADSQ